MGAEKNVELLAAKPGVLAYLRMWFRFTIRGSLDVTQLVAFVLLLVAWFVAYTMTGDLGMLAEKISDLAQGPQLAVAILLSVVTTRAVVAPYLIHQAQLVASMQIAGKIAEYEATAPRVVVTQVSRDFPNPYRVSIHARVSNPGDPTIMTDWSVSVCGPSGEAIPATMVPGREDSPDEWICKTVDSGPGRPSQITDYALTPLPTGGMARAQIDVDFVDPVCAVSHGLPLRFSVHCRTVKKVPSDSTIFEVKSFGRNRAWPADEGSTVDKDLGIEPRAERTHAERLPMVRALFDKLVEEANRGEERPLYHIGHHLITLSHNVNGDSMEYVADFERFKAGLIRGKARDADYDGSG